MTGTSVLALKFAGGVMLAADTLGSYGSLARYTELRRLRAVGPHCVVGAGGEYSDFQKIVDMLDELTTHEAELDDGQRMGAPELHAYLTRVMYARRNKGNPLWNALLVAGFRDGAATLGYLDHLGTAFSDDFSATGFGADLALPIIRDRWRADLSEAEARQILEDCLRVLWYRDTRALNKVQVATITAAGTVISEPYSLSAKWCVRRTQLRARALSARARARARSPLTPARPATIRAAGTTSSSSRPRRGSTRAGRGEKGWPAISLHDDDATTACRVRPFPSRARACARARGRARRAPWTSCGRAPSRAPCGSPPA